MYLFTIYVYSIFYCPLLLGVLVPGVGEQEIFGVGQSISTDRAKLRQAEVISIRLCDPSFDLLLAIDCEFYSPGYYQYLLGFDNKFPHLRSHEQSALVRDDQKIAIGVIECLFAHGCISWVVIYSESLFDGWVTCSRHCNDTLHEIYFLVFWHRGNRSPPELIGMVMEMCTMIEIGQYFILFLRRVVLALNCGWPYFIQPRLLIVTPFDSEGGAW